MTNCRNCIYYSNEKFISECSVCNENSDNFIDKKSYNKAIDDMHYNLIRSSKTEVINGKICLIVTDERIYTITKMMKGGEEI